jgi:putative membrane protein
MPRQPTHAPYNRFEQAEFLLRDELAIDRTRLANERTYLAYIRSALALLIAGSTIIHYADNAWFMLVGVACLPLGIAFAIVGTQRFLRLHRALKGLHSPAETPAET